MVFSLVSLIKVFVFVYVDDSSVEILCWYFGFVCMLLIRVLRFCVDILDLYGC